MKNLQLILPLAAAVLATGCASQQPIEQSAQYQALQSQQKQLKQQNEQLRSQLSAQKESSKDQKSSLLPPNPKPGHCYARAVVPPTYKTDMQKVEVSSADTKIKTIPAQYKTVQKKVMVKAATSKLITVPATYKTVSQKILVHPAYNTWKKGHGPIEKLNEATGEIMCLVKVPAEYKTVTKKEVATPAHTETREIPAVYKTINVVEQVKGPREVKQTIPAVYKEVPKHIKVTDAHMEWRQILCATNTTPDVIKQLQEALKSKGYDPVWIDGVYGWRTRDAMIKYQKANKLPSGQLTLKTLESLGVM